MTRGLDPLGPSEHARHSQDWWQSLATGDAQLPNWLRVAAFAYGRHGNNLHASLRRLELAEALGESGQPVPRQRLKEWIDQAVSRGFLAPGSTSMCLIVPAGCVDKGPIGAPKAPCRLHSRRAKAASEASGRPASPADSLLKESRLRQDSLDEVSEIQAGNPDASRSDPLSSPTAPQATVTALAFTQDNREASA